MITPWVVNIIYLYFCKTPALPAQKKADSGEFALFMPFGIAPAHYEQVVTWMLQISWNLLRFSQHNFRGWEIFERKFDEVEIWRTIFCKSPKTKDFVLQELVDFLLFKWLKNNEISIISKFLPCQLACETMFGIMSRIICN
jgi:hypothetical protein